MLEVLGMRSPAQRLHVSLDAFFHSTDSLDRDWRCQLNRTSTPISPVVAAPQSPLPPGGAPPRASSKWTSEP